MAAAPSAPDVPAHFTFPSGMIGALTEVGAYLDAGDLPQAKSRFTVLTGIPKKLHSDIAALFTEMEGAPKAAAAAAPSTAVTHYRSRITQLIAHAQKEEQDFQELLHVGGWEPAFSNLLIFSHRLLSCINVYLKNTPSDNRRNLFVKDYYIAINQFFTTAKTQPLVRVINTYCLEIAQQPPKKRTIYGKFDQNTLKIVRNGFLDVVTNFVKALQPVHSERLKCPNMNRDILPVRHLSHAGYVRRGLFERAFGELHTIFIVMQKDILIDVNQDHFILIENMIRGKLTPRIVTRFIRQLKQLHKNTQQTCCDLCNETNENYDRYGTLYDPIFNSPQYETLMYSGRYNPSITQYLKEQAEWLNEFPCFVTNISSRTNDLIDIIVLRLKSLLNLQTWMMTADLSAWQAENQSFDRLVKSLPERLQTMKPADYGKLKVALEANPLAANYRELIRHKVQALLDFQSAFNGLFSLYTHDIDETDNLTYVGNFTSHKTWGAVKPYTRYKTIRWPTGEVENTRNVSLTILGKEPKKDNFDFLGRLSLSDIPFLESLDDEEHATSIARCISELKKLRPGETMCVFPEPVSKKPKATPKPETSTDPVEEIEEDAEAAPVVATSAALKPLGPIQRIRETLLEKMAQAYKIDSVEGVKPILKQAETQLRNLFALTASFEGSLHYSPISPSQIFHDCVSIIETIALLFEQMAQAVGMPCDLTHDISMLMKNNPNLIRYLNADEYRMILDTNRAGFYTRDIAFLELEGTTITNSQKLLVGAYKYKTTTAALSLSNFVGNLSGYCCFAFKTIDTLLDYMIDPKKKASRSAEFSTQVTLWQENFSAPHEATPPPSLPPTKLQEKAYIDINFIIEFVGELHHPKLLGGQDYQLLFDNLFQNKLSRLNTEIAKQTKLNPDELAFHLATILNLTHLIAADVLYLHLLALEHQGHPVVIPETKSLIDLVASHNGKELPEHVRTFVHTPLRNVARYAETADQKRSDKKTTTAAKRMRRAIAHSAAAAPIAPAAPEAIATKEADLKAGFEEVESRVVVETKELAVKYIERLRELIEWVCVTPKKPV